MLCWKDLEKILVVQGDGGGAIKCNVSSKMFMFRVIAKNVCYHTNVVRES